MTKESRRLQRRIEKPLFEVDPKEDYLEEAVYLVFVLNNYPRKW